MRPSVTYTLCGTYSKKQTDNIITFTQFEEENLLSETHDNEQISEESNDHSIMPPLISKEEMNDIDYGDESYDKNMST